MTLYSMADVMHGSSELISFHLDKSSDLRF